MEEATAEATYELRYAGQAFELTISGPVRPDPADLAERFAAEHERRYGYRDPGAEIELVHIQLALVVPSPRPSPRAAPAATLSEGVREARFAGEWVEARVLRGEPRPGPPPRALRSRAS